MRGINHLTPRYVWARTKEKIYQNSYPDHPWLTRNSVDLLAQLLKPTDIALEFGSGRSTIWFARRVAHITSIEHHPDWHMQVAGKLRASRLNNVDLILRRTNRSGAADSSRDYVEVAKGFAKSSLDFCLVDGEFRDECALAVLPKLKSGSVLAVDNASWFMPSPSVSPNSVPLGGTPYSPKWQEFLDKTQDWRRIWTYSGVTATVLYFKP